MDIVPVNSPKTKKVFLDTARIIYKDDNNWVCPLDIEVENTFDPKHNRCFSTGEASRWVLLDDTGKPIGRIAAFYDEKKAWNNNKQATGGIGFFECVQDQNAANLLFDTAKTWLQSKSMEAMDGPINFGENFVNWGLLVDGFVHQGYGMPYNMPYYKNLFENYGFRNYFEQYSYHVDLSKPFNPRMVKFAEYIGSKPEYSFKHLEFSRLDKYIDDLVIAYNTIWFSYHDSYTPLKKEDIRTMVDEAKPILDEELIWFAYYNEQPIAFVVVFPDVNQIIKPFKGKLNFINKLRFVLRKSLKVISRSRVLIAGVVPEFQKSGILGALFLQYIRALERKPQHKEIELSWVGDYNPEMERIYRHIGGVKAKTHVTYRYLFSPEKPFKRFTNTSKNEGDE